MNIITTQKEIAHYMRSRHAATNMLAIVIALFIAQCALALTFIVINFVNNQ
jgi:hypothetical protein